MRYMTWIRAHYDRVAVLAAALFLLCSALLIMRKRLAVR